MPFLALLVAWMAAAGPPTAAAGAAAHGLYVFGDSTADVGNNNYLPDAAVRANFPHNGVDFPAGRATGRFSNGYNGIDFLAMHLGFRRSPPPFLSLTNRHRPGGLKGANFASAGSGILDATVDEPLSSDELMISQSHFWTRLHCQGSTIPFSKQIKYFEDFMSNMTADSAAAPRADVIQKSIFLVSTGGNDIFAFFMRNNTPAEADKQRFVANLISAYSDRLKDLYQAGARKLGLIDAPPIGCCPYTRSLHPTGGCIDVLNELAWRFNKAVQTMMAGLSSELPGLKYSIGSSHEVVSSIIKNPAKLGFKEVNAACCGAGMLNGQSGCTPNATLCADRRQFLFWDMLHPTHATAKLAAAAIYNGSLRFAAPVNLRTLAGDV